MLNVDLSSSKICINFSTSREAKVSVVILSTLIVSLISLVQYLVEKYSTWFSLLLPVSLEFLPTA